MSKTIMSGLVTRFDVIGSGLKTTPKLLSKVVGSGSKLKDLVFSLLAIKFSFLCNFKLVAI